MAYAHDNTRPGVTLMAYAHDNTRPGVTLMVLVKQLIKF